MLFCAIHCTRNPRLWHRFLFLIQFHNTNLEMRALSSDLANVSQARFHQHSSPDHRGAHSHRWLRFTHLPDSIFVSPTRTTVDLFRSTVTAETRQRESSDFDFIFESKERKYVHEQCVFRRQRKQIVRGEFSSTGCSADRSTDWQSLASVESDGTGSV